MFSGNDAMFRRAFFSLEKKCSSWLFHQLWFFEEYLVENLGRFYHRTCSFRAPFRKEELVVWPRMKAQNTRTPVSCNLLGVSIVLLYIELIGMVGPVVAQRKVIQEFGKRFGCHSCGTKKGPFIADHQPPNKQALDNIPQR